MVSFLKRLKVFVCGSVGYGGKEEVTSLQHFLKSAGFDVIDQFENGDYADVEDFRGKHDLCRKIVLSDLQKCMKADVVVLVASRPSFGAAIESFTAATRGKPVIAYCPEKTRSPWPLHIAQYVARSKEELASLLQKIKSPSPKFKIRVIPNVHSGHKAKFTYDGFTCLCPVTGKPDKAKIEVEYIPRNKLIEYESLSDYFKFFRGKPLHHEEVVSIILKDLMERVEPEYIKVTAEFKERSGVKATVSKQAGKIRPSHC